MGRPQAAEPSHHRPSKYCCGIFIKCSDSGPAGAAAGPACSPDQGWAAWEAGALLVHILNQKKLGMSHQVLAASQIVQGLGVPMERCCYLPVNWVITDRRILLSWHIVLFILGSLDNKTLFTLGRKGGGPMWIQNVTKKAKNGSVSLRDIKPPAGKQKFQNISLRKKKPQHFTSVSNFKNIKEWFFDFLCWFLCWVMPVYAILWYSEWPDFQSQDVVWC